jgi:hypothetical protein
MTYALTVSSGDTAQIAAQMPMLPDTRLGSTFVGPSAGELPVAGTARRPRDCPLKPLEPCLWESQGRIS